MERSAHGYWLADVGPVTAEAVLPPGAHSADVAVIGGGYLGMWTAWRLAERGADVVLCESGICGEGPSGRNGGFVNPLWDRSEELRELFGDDGAKRLAHASPPDFWYQQTQDEWVLLLSGSAQLRFADEAQARTLQPGDFVEIAAQRRHRVDATASGQASVWLAIHYPAENSGAAQ